MSHIFSSVRVKITALVVIAALLLILALAATPAPAQGNAAFSLQSVNAGAGINFTHKKLGGYWGVGQAWGDYDGDGWLDLYLTDQLKSNILYHNNGDGTFSVSAINNQVHLGAYNTRSGGAGFVDYDNDGDQDLFVLGFGPHALLRNELVESGSPGFTNVTVAAGVGATNERKGETAGWGDYDGDGDLDLYIANWYCKDGRDACDVDPALFDGNADILYRNNGDGTFTDVSSLLNYSDLLGAGFVGSFVDYDNDGDQDIYVINDMQANPIGNKLWRNDGPGPNCGLAATDWCFAEVASAVGADTTLCGMGLAIGDYDHDLDLDFYFSNAPPCGDGIHHFLENQTSQGSATFIDRSVAAGVDIGGVGWGTLFSDFDNDGFEDLFLARTGNNDNPSGEDHYSVVFANNGDSTFANLGGIAGPDFPGAGAAFADYDRDGRIDVVAGPFNGPFHLYQNQSPAANEWLSIRLIGSPSNGVNRDAVGARVFLETSAGTRVQAVVSGSSLGAGNQTGLHFGLGPAGTQALLSLTVVWPDGTQQLFTGPLSPNSHYVWTYGSDPIVDPTAPPPGPTPTPTVPTTPTPTDEPTPPGPTPTPTVPPTATPPGPSPTPTVVPTATPTSGPSMATGWQSPSANAPLAGGDGDGFEVDATNAYLDDGLFAVDVDSGNHKHPYCGATTKDSHVFSGYALGLPGGATITGVEVRLDAKADATASQPNLCVQLSSDGGATWTTAQTTPLLATTELTYWLGAPNDLWGRTWAAADFDPVNFQVRLVSVARGVTRDFSLDWVAVNVHYQ